MKAYKNLLNELLAEWPDNRILNFVFLGDSITAGYMETPHVNLTSHYPAQFMTWMNRTFPTASINLINAGVGGDHLKGGLARLQRDVVDHRPDLVTICYGMNDFGQGAEGLSSFKESYKILIEQLRKAGIECILPMTTMPHFDRTLLEKQQLYMDAIVETAQEEHLPVADVFRKWLEKERMYKSPLLFYSNRFNHPSEAGHAIYARTMIEAFTECTGCTDVV